MIRKCKVCKKKTNFKEVHVHCTKSYCYLGGDYLYLFRCDNCKSIIGMRDEELK